MILFLVYHHLFEVKEVHSGDKLKGKYQCYLSVNCSL